jgi:DnaJ-class molecular chaperone
MSYYEVLNVSKDASIDEIKKAYRQLSMKYHPDRNPDPNAVAEMGKINEAYETLGDGNKRRMYDMENSLLQGGIPMDMHNMMNSFFNMGGLGGLSNMASSFSHSTEPEIHFFSGTNLNDIFDQISRPPSIKKQIYITFEESYFGVSKDITIDKWTIIHNQKIAESAKMAIHIPPGIQNHETITVEKQGNKMNDRIIGDIMITIVVQEHDVFQRENNDLVYYKTISLKEALCGFCFNFVHLNKKQYLLNNEKNHMIINHGHRKTINGLGFQRNGQNGNLIIEFSVNFPENLSAETIEQLKNIL